MNEEKKLNDLINHLWGSVIKNINYDFQKNKIHISLDLKYTDRTENYEIMFFNVSSFYMINDSGSKRFKISRPEYLELTSIDYYKSGIGKIDIHPNSLKDDWVDLWYSNANFIVEIWDSLFFIEAEAIQINDEYFHVGFPEMTT